MCMKTIFLLCVLACGCQAFHGIDIKSLFSHQQVAMQKLMTSYDKSSNDPLVVNKCFNDYMTAQSDVVNEYNFKYYMCISTAQASKDQLTEQNADKRENLLSRGHNMCDNLNYCDQHVDGYEFFDCYRNASTDGYKIMFTLNSDANTHFNFMSARYSVIETDLAFCIDESRVNYAKKMDAANDDLQICLNGGKPSTTESASTTTTSVPVTTTEVSSSSAAPTSTSSAAPTSTSSAAPTSTSSDAPTSTSSDAPTTSTSSPVSEDTTAATAEEFPQEDLERFGILQLERI